MDPSRGGLCAVCLLSCLDGNADPIVRVDAANSPDGATSAFCASLNPQPLFCADFDEGSYSASFSSMTTTNGSLALDTAEFVSPPAALVATSNALTGPTGKVDTTLYRTFPLAGQTLTATLDVDLRVDRADAAPGGAVFAQIGLVDAAGAEYFVQLSETATAAGPLSGDFAEVYVPTTGPESYVGHGFAQTLPLGTWTHVTLSLTAPFAGGAATATLSFDGTEVQTNAIDVRVSNFTPNIGVGLPFSSSPSNGWTAVLDNVTFRATTS